MVNLAPTLRTPKGNTYQTMKFLLKPLLLFLLILAGKAVKQQSSLSGSIADKQHTESSMAIQPKELTSFFTRQINSTPVQVNSTRQLWHTTAARIEPVNFD